MVGGNGRVRNESTPSKEAKLPGCTYNAQKLTGRPPAEPESADYLRRQTDHIIEA